MQMLLLIPIPEIRLSCPWPDFIYLQQKIHGSRNPRYRANPSTSSTKRPRNVSIPPLIRLFPLAPSLGIQQSQIHAVPLAPGWALVIAAILWCCPAIAARFSRPSY
ncbi:hypothetical protein M431DRAFT_345458 [Trichoderma harzianum CBS 226.95]|uniref:Uncharacterized protein n=1 Tax=Trichoderma harzianum CBS 226.95 TaxID=983964 RepID=A0A2T4AKJ9_TRIHA|nr:hypothetical protein M431DRAFT_345458 [Trichoderma harzianum CBS 226.95]PTB57610.1 hypothetical protein M431DRAFT_345458 [Trichoderma harzianum CBS 226.95]